MTAIVMLVSGSLFVLIAAMLRFEPNARILTQYSDNAVASKNRRASKYFFLIAMLSFVGGVVSLTFPHLAMWAFTGWLFTVVVGAFLVISNS